MAPYFSMIYLSCNRIWSREFRVLIARFRGHSHREFFQPSGRTRTNPWTKQSIQLWNYIQRYHHLNSDDTKNRKRNVSIKEKQKEKRNQVQFRLRFDDQFQYTKIIAVVFCVSVCFFFLFVSFFFLLFFSSSHYPSSLSLFLPPSLHPPSIPPLPLSLYLSLFHWILFFVSSSFICFFLGADLS